MLRTRSPSHEDESHLVRLPSKQLLLDYLQLYIDERSSTRQSTGNFLKNTWERGTYYVTWKKPADRVLDQLVMDIQLQINNTKEWKDWYLLIFTLREKAEEAQAEKSRLVTQLGAEKESLLRKTFHGMASLIVSELRKCDTQLSLQIEKLKDELENTIEAGNFSVYDKLGLMRNHFVKTENDMLSVLACLCDIDSIHRAGKHGLLDHLRPPSTEEAELLKAKHAANLCGPFALQEGYGEWVYAQHYQPTQQIAFDDFKSRAYVNETLEIGNEIQRKTLEIQSSQKREEMEQKEFKKQDELKQQMETLLLNRSLSNGSRKSMGSESLNLFTASGNQEKVISGLQQFGHFAEFPLSTPDDPTPQLSLSKS